MTQFPPQTRAASRSVTSALHVAAWHVITLAAIVAGVGVPVRVGAQAVDTIRVRVHNHDVALYRTGSAGPVVVLEAGGGSSHHVYNALTPLLAQHARVISYDRPGYGLSAPCDSPRTALRIALELNDALTAAGINSPVYMAGWSYGGAIARVFAGQFGSRTTGLLLIDPAPEDFYARAAREQPDLWTLEEEAYFPGLYTDSTRRAEQRELAGYAPGMEQARLSDEKHALPTIMLIAGKDASGPPDAISAIWIDELERWAARRPSTTAIRVPGVGHHIAREKPAVVVDAFLKLVSETDRP